jgi:hypothetical protein
MDSIHLSNKSLPREARFGLSGVRNAEGSASSYPLLLPCIFLECTSRHDFSLPRFGVCNLSVSSPCKPGSSAVLHGQFTADYSSLRSCLEANIFRWCVSRRRPALNSSNQPQISLYSRILFLSRSTYARPCWRESHLPSLWLLGYCLLACWEVGWKLGIGSCLALERDSQKPIRWFVGGTFLFGWLRLSYHPWHDQKQSEPLGKCQSSSNYFDSGFLL